MRDYLPEELALIGCPHRTDSMQPEKAVFQEEEEHVLDPYSFFRRPNGPIERVQLKSCLMDKDVAVDRCEHLLRTITLLFVVACAKGYLSY